MAEITRVGVIGLGNMGLGIAGSLLRAGFAVIGCDPSTERRALAQGRGVTVMALAEILRTADAILCSLPNGPVVEAVLTTPDALLARTDRRVIVLDTSTVDPATSRRLHARLAHSGHGHLDAPVSGGPVGAEAGSLAVMLGGNAADVAAVQKLLAAISARAVHVGPSGAGNVAKLVNNMLVAAHMITTGEAMRLAVAAGVDAAAVLDVINAATGRSGISELHFPKWIMTGGFDSGFAAGLMRKDVGLAADLAAEVGLDLPLSRTVAGMWLDDRTTIPDAADFTLMSGFSAKSAP